MINDFTLKFGRAPGTSATNIPAAPVTVFVGPNNSGKSKVLTEIFSFCHSGRVDANSKLLDKLTFSGLSDEEAANAIRRITVPANPGEAQNVESIFVGSRYGRYQVPHKELINSIRVPQSNSQGFCEWFLKHNTLLLDGSSRIGLTADQPAGDLQQPPQTSFQWLFRDDAKRQEARRIIFEAFGTYFVLDPTNLGKLRIRLSDRAPLDDVEERGIHSDAVRFHASAQHIQLASDGVKAFTGIITEVMAGDPRVLLIDEPEAFLHPSLASKLGLELSRASLSSDKRVFVSTHSPTFVMGCIQSGAPVNIVRLTYRGGVATARVLPSEDLLKLMRNPLLRSTGVLSGLFYEFVVVSESDADRAFYQEVNERLLQFRPDWGIPNCLFINAQNKQTVQTLIGPLRQLGIPAAGIVDVDVLKDGGTNWTNVLHSANIPAIQHGSLATMRASIKQAMDASGKDMKRDGGVSILPVTDREACENLLSQLAEYGIFVVPGGELEAWLTEQKIGGHGPTWLINMFDAMGNDPANPAYIKPSDGDVWEFLRRVKSWLTNAHRKGIPT
ncbi:MAG: ATP-dependent nuclease [Rubinisphaera brasiliensis]|uniref:ATP-dependent nuclease n=1 Tax=Rubinisphaera brasiliensis TaxID=119 RepID=UPI00391C7065